MRWLPSGCESATLLFACVLILGVASTFQTHIDGFSLIVKSGFVERICDGVIVSEA